MDEKLANLGGNFRTEHKWVHLGDNNAPPRTWAFVEDEDNTSVLSLRWHRVVKVFCLSCV